MSDSFVVEPQVVDKAAQQIAAAGHTVGDLRMSSSFHELSDAFAGATDPMTDVASSGDGKVQSSIKNAASSVQGWSEMIMGFKGAAVSLDDENAQYVRNAAALPQHATVDPDNRR